MEPRLLALKLVLNELEVDPDISTVDKRKGVQKAIYLGQAAGLDLGHRYGWYVKGPYSPSLARDYYALAEAIAVDDDDSNQFELDRITRSSLEKVKPLMTPIGSASKVKVPSWLELLASVHFLLTVRKETVEQARTTIATKKSHVVDYFDEALEVLRGAKLIPG